MIWKKSGFIFLSMLIAATFAQAGDINLGMQMPSHTFFPGMPCKLDLKIQNSGPYYNNVQLYVALTVGTGEYWFYPNWRHYPDDVDWLDITIPQFSESTISIIPEFEWPEGVGEFSGAMFLAAIVDGATLISNIPQFDFGWRETYPTPTPTSTQTPGPDTPTPTPTSTPTSTPTPVPTNFVYIPAGTFQMGSPSDEMCRDSDEGPVHTVTLTHGFYIQSTEVTQRQWVNVFGTNPSYYEGMNRPVEYVTWYDCCIYCNRLSLAEGLTPCYYSDASYTTVFDGTPPVTSGTVYWNQSANGYRLPTEAEWEYACRAGTTTAYNSGQDNTYCDRDLNLYSLARYRCNGGYYHHHAEVGSYQPNAWGLYDMHGNVYEWCWDWYSWGYHSTSPSTDPVGPSSGSARAGRGGGWYDYAEYCRSAYRYSNIPGYRDSSVGFRLVRLSP